jgi:hypothetical protein
VLEGLLAETSHNFNETLLLLKVFPKHSGLRNSLIRDGEFSDLSEVFVNLDYRFISRPALLSSIFSKAASLIIVPIYRSLLLRLEREGASENFCIIIPCFYVGLYLVPSSKEA